MAIRHAPGRWHTAGRWNIENGTRPDTRCIVTVSGDTAWRLLFNALSADEARRRMTIHGDPLLARPLLDARSVIV
jgi:hypothetical protein